MLAETMFRVTPWAGMGNSITEAPNSAEAIKLAGLDWQVKQQPSFIMIDDKPVKTGDVINYRDSDNSILGTVKDRYQVVQNHEAFEFTDALIESGDARYETAGSLFGGKWYGCSQNFHRILYQVIKWTDFCCSVIVMMVLGLLQ